MEIRESKWIENFKENWISGNEIKTSQKLYKDARMFYESIDESLDPQTVMYTVYSCEQGELKTGNLNWGLSVLEPVTVKGECNVTRGHFHEDLDCDEIYVCAQGEGFLLLMDADGKCTAEIMKPGSIHHIDGYQAHRLVNTGDTQLAVMCCWPSTAGHDYGRVEAMPFSVRAFKCDNKIIWKEGE